jgi:hypothetical protein
VIAVETPLLSPPTLSMRSKWSLTRDDDVRLLVWHFPRPEKTGRPLWRQKALPSQMDHAGTGRSGTLVTGRRGRISSLARRGGAARICPSGRSSAIGPAHSGTGHGSPPEMMLGSNTSETVLSLIT